MEKAVEATLAASTGTLTLAIGFVILTVDLLASTRDLSLFSVIFETISNKFQSKLINPL